MTTQPARLAETVEAIRNGGDIRTYVDEVCDRVDERDPDVRALLPESDRRARLRADAEALRDRYDDEPPLFGVPVGVKDIIHVDGFTTRAGSAMPPEPLQGPEASVVSALREAGALVLGKTVTTEFAGGAPGPTRNPHDLGHTPGGSSSGSAAAVAAGMCPLALGTQTGGSVIRPAAFCGVVGFKPSFERIPRDGVLLRSETLDHVGLFTQDVAGMELAASVVCEEWTGSAADGRPTLGVPEGPYLRQASIDARDAYRAQVGRLEDAGYEIERVRTFEDFEETDRKRGHVSDAELALQHAEWFEEYEPFYRAPSARRIRTGGEVTAKQLAEGRAVVRRRRETLEGRMDDRGIDVWISPATTGPAPEGITSTGDPVMNRPWTDSGFPTLTLPAGEIDGLPIGLQCAARFGNDESLLAWASDLREAL